MSGRLCSSDGFSSRALKPDVHHESETAGGGDVCAREASRFSPCSHHELFGPVDTELRVIVTASCDQAAVSHHMWSVSLSGECTPAPHGPGGPAGEPGPRPGPPGRPLSCAAAHCVGTLQLPGVDGRICLNVNEMLLRNMQQAQISFPVSVKTKEKKILGETPRRNIR